MFKLFKHIFQPFYLFFLSIHLSFFFFNISIWKLFIIKKYSSSLVVLKRLEIIFHISKGTLDALLVAELIHISKVILTMYTTIFIGQSWHAISQYWCLVSLFSSMNQSPYQSPRARRKLPRLMNLLILLKTHFVETRVGRVILCLSNIEYCVTLRVHRSLKTYYFFIIE